MDLVGERVHQSFPKYEVVRSMSIIFKVFFRATLKIDRHSIFSTDTLLLDVSEILKPV